MDNTTNKKISKKIKNVKLVKEYIYSITQAVEFGGIIGFVILFWTIGIDNMMAWSFPVIILHIVSLLASTIPYFDGAGQIAYWFATIFSFVAAVFDIIYFSITFSKYGTKLDDISIAPIREVVINKVALAILATVILFLRIAILIYFIAQKVWVFFTKANLAIVRTIELTSEFNLVTSERKAVYNILSGLKEGSETEEEGGILNRF